MLVVPMPLIGDTTSIYYSKTLASPSPVLLGSYRGFALEIGFDFTSHQFEVYIAGSLKRTVPLGTDEAGAITRIDNAIRRIPQEPKARQKEVSMER